jgi:hypothetical protein
VRCSRCDYAAGLASSARSTWISTSRRTRRTTRPPKARLLEDLIDSAIFQLVYDFVNPGEQDRDLRKWRNVINNPPPFTSPAAVSALYQAQGALASYYVRGNW